MLPDVDCLEFVKDCIIGGVTAVQLREKGVDWRDTSVKKFGKELKNLLDILGVPLIINDSIEFTQYLNAQGVHLGQTDYDLYSARKLLGPDKIIGASVSSMEDLSRVEKLDIDYIGAGAVFKTDSKRDALVMGLETLSIVCMASKYPVVAVGGIGLTNTTAVMNAGAHGISVIKALHKAKEPLFTAKKLRYLVEQEVV